MRVPLQGGAYLARGAGHRGGEPCQSWSRCSPLPSWWWWCSQSSPSRRGFCQAARG